MTIDDEFRCDDKKLTKLCGALERFIISTGSEYSTVEIVVCLSVMMAASIAAVPNEHRDELMELEREAFDDALFQHLLQSGLESRND